MLLKASENGDTKTVSALLKQGMDANVRDEVWCVPEVSFSGGSRGGSMEPMEPPFL